jgi:hypothetical protein
VKHQILPDAVDVFRNHGIVYKLGRPVDFGGELPSDCNLFFKRIEINLMLVDVALANHLRILLLGER